MSSMHSLNTPKQSPSAESKSPEATDDLSSLEQGLVGIDDETQYPSWKVVLPVIISMYLAFFLVALDRTIIGVAVPTISDHFHSFGDVSWYESAYLLTFAACQLPMGKLFSFYPAKWAFMSIVLIFEIGSVICAAAPNSTAFIIGRALAGVGSAGATTGTNVLLRDLLPLHKRPKYQGFLGASFALASIAGPLLGGVFTSKLSWRWCFYINLPIGGCALLVLFFVLPLKPAPREHRGHSFLQRLRQYDPVGTALVLPGLILLLLGLQWGGNGTGWSSAKIMAPLVLGIVLLVIFGATQIWIGEDGTIPPRIIRQRSIAVVTIVSLGFGSCLIIVVFFLPIWYQAIQGLSAVAAGIRMLASFLTTSIAVIASGFLVSKTGYYAPWLSAGLAVQMIGYGLMTTLAVDTSDAKVIGYQIIIGAGLGLALAQPNNAVQAVLSRADIPTGITIVNFSNFAGGTIFISVCQGVLSSTLASRLRQSIPNLDASTISASGATDLSKLVSKEDVPKLLDAYNAGIVNVFYCAVGLAGFAFVASLFMEWKTMNKCQKGSEN